MKILHKHLIDKKNNLIMNHNNEQPTLDTYVKKLPYKKDTLIEYIPKWEQSINYNVRDNPILKVERLFLSFHKENKEIFTNTVNLISHNISFWNIVCKYVDETYLLISKSYQQANRSFLMTQIKELVVHQDVKKYLSSRRMYPILEMLDHSKCEFTKKHRKACGFFLAFFLERNIQIEDELFTYYLNTSTDNIIRINRNASGFWYDEILDKK